MLNSLHIKPSNKIFTYNMDFICYTSQLDWKNSVLYHHYYQRLPNQIQDPISTREQGKPTSFQDMYTLAMTINHCYQEHDYKCHHARQAEKEALESHFQKQGKTSTSGPTITFQNKANPSLVVSSTKTSFSKLSLSPTPKKQSNFLQVDFFSKLASNGKLTSNKCKKHLENNLCLYYSIEGYKLDSYPKGYSASATADPLVAASEKPLEKQRVTFRTSYRLRATLNFPVQQ